MMHQRTPTFASVTLLLLDGAALGFLGSAISGLASLPGASWLGLALLVADLALALLIMRRGIGRSPALVAAILAINAALVAASGLYVGQVDDAPGAGGIGLILSLASLGAAFMVVRKARAA